MRVVLRLAEATQPLDDILRSRWHAQAPESPGVRPVVAVLVILPEWPGVKLPMKLATDFEISVAIEHSAVRRPVDLRPGGRGEPLPGKRLLGSRAEQFVAELVAKTKVTEDPVI